MDFIFVLGGYVFGTGRYSVPVQLPFFRLRDLRGIFVFHTLILNKKINIANLILKIKYEKRKIFLLYNMAS